MKDIIRQKILDSESAPDVTFTRRDIYVPEIPNKAIAVIGMRRTGKTTFLQQVLTDRMAAGTPREGILFFSFDDERLQPLEGVDLGILLEEYYRLHPEWRQQKRALFLLDEIQEVRGWERFARRILDSENIELYLSGSSARLLSREVATSMRGRAMEARVFPFSFAEFLRHKGAEPKDPDRATAAEKSFLRRELERYMKHGGFPEAQSANSRDRVDLLRGYVDASLLRDVIERHTVTNPGALRWLTRQLLGNAAGLFSANRFFNDLKSQGMRIGKDSLHAYLGHLQDCFLIHTVWLSTESERRRQSNPRKVYPADPALIPIFDRSGRLQSGKALETLVFLDLLRRGARISYVQTRTGYEVDFLARWPDGSSELIQVCAQGWDRDTQQREIRALDAAREAYPDATLSVVTLSPESFRDLPGFIRLHDAALWLLRG